MVTVGNNALPGTILNIESTESSGTGGLSPGVPVFIGQADLDEGSADAETAYRVTRTNRAIDLFGPASTSLLSRAIRGALREGAYPAYAIAAPETAETEDLSGESGEFGTLSNVPLREDVDDITFTINSATKDTTIHVSGDPENATPDTDEVLVNPQTGKWHADEAVGNTGDEAVYESVDYTNIYDEIDTAEPTTGVYLRDIADFIAPVDENSTVTDDTKSHSESMELEGWFNITVAGAGEPYIADTASFTNSYDTSRLQLVYPTRDPDGNTIIGEYVGRRSEIGIDSYPIFKRIETITRLQENLTRTQREDLDAENVIPLEERRRNVRIVEDHTTVSDTNDDESSWDRGYNRLLTDYISELADERAEPHIGAFNEIEELNSMRGKVSSDLNQLISTGQIQAYSLVAEKEDALSAVLDIGAKLADPLRNIDITVGIGDVSNPTADSGGDN